MNEQDATILDLQKSVMNYQEYVDDLQIENDELIEQNEELQERIYELESHPHRYHRASLIFALIATLQTINLLIALL